jgi:hypothetical protein
VYSCFSSLGNEVSDTDKQIVTDENALTNREACCKSILPAWKQMEEQQSNRVGSIHPFPMDQCLLEIANVPKVSNEHGGSETAKHAWMVSKSTTAALANAGQQFLYDASSSSSFSPIQTPSPFHLNGETTSSQQLFPLLADSELDPSGGMHRLLHHSMILDPVVSTYYLYVVVPSGMFVDLDDPLEVSTSTSQVWMSPMEPTSGAKCAFSIVQAAEQDNATSSTTVQVHLHAATICDIEQPAFVSGQHILVWEIRSLHRNKNQPTRPLHIATKLHLRYPQPLPSMERWIDLPKPLLFGYLNDDTTEQTIQSLHQQQSNDLSKSWTVDVLDPVFVAAGNSLDYAWVMGITIASCFIGVVWMLQDISRVSLWDSV